jgi:hypothetical protein
VISNHCALLPTKMWNARVAIERRQRDAVFGYGRIKNLRAAVELHFAHYNFVGVHRSFRVTPAMEARVSDRLWSLDELVERTAN